MNGGTGIIVCAFDQANTGKEENSAQDAINNEGFHLLFAFTAVKKQYGCIDESYDTQYGQNDAKGSFCVHIPFFRPYRCKKTAKGVSEQGIKDR